MSKSTAKIESHVPPTLKVTEVKVLWENGSYARLPETKSLPVEFILSSIVYCSLEKMTLGRIYLMACLLTLAPFMVYHFQGLTCFYHESLSLVMY